jgi:hypothetical protein
MRPFGLTCLGFISLLWLTCAVARAEPLDDDAASPPQRAPTAAEVISQLYQFDQFQQNVSDSAEFRTTQTVANTAAARADAAVKRDLVLSELQRQIGAEPTSRKAAAMRAHALLGVDSSDGPDYVRQFYAAQLAEYEATVALLERYLQSPDNDDVRSFAAAQLALLRSELIDIRGALADK